MKKTMLEILKWVATITLIVGTAINGLGYYPEGPLVLVLGGVLWLVASIIMKDEPLIVTNTVMSVVGLGTVVFKLFG